MDDKKRDYVFKVLDDGTPVATFISALDSETEPFIVPLDWSGYSLEQMLHECRQLAGTESGPTLVEVHDRNNDAIHDYVPDWEEKTFEERWREFRKENPNTLVSLDIREEFPDFEVAQYMEEHPERDFAEDLTLYRRERYLNNVARWKVMSIWDRDLWAEELTTLDLWIADKGPKWDLCMQRLDASWRQTRKHARDLCKTIVDKGGKRCVFFTGTLNEENRAKSLSDGEWVAIFKEWCEVELYEKRGISFFANIDFHLDGTIHLHVFASDHVPVSDWFNKFGGNKAEPFHGSVSKWCADYVDKISGHSVKRSTTSKQRVFRPFWSKDLRGIRTYRSPQWKAEEEYRLKCIAKAKGEDEDVPAPKRGQKAPKRERQ